MNSPATEVNVINRDISNADINLQSPILRVVVLRLTIVIPSARCIMVWQPSLLPLILSPEKKERFLTFIVNGIYQGL
jgi:hypothetical protein